MFGISSKKSGTCVMGSSGHPTNMETKCTRSKHERAEYPDVDLLVVRDDNGVRYTRKNGEPFK